MSLARFRGTIAGVAAASLALSLPACGSDSRKSAAGPERPQIRVGMLPITEVAPLQLAIQKGLFRAEGLTVKTEMLAGGAASLPKLKGGSLDISFGNYVSFLQARAQGALKPRIVADAVQNAPKALCIMVTKDSPIRTPADLAGKQIATNTKRNISTLLVRAGLMPYNVEVNEDKSFVEAPFPQHEQLLRDKKVSAAIVPEPFVTVLQQRLGARILVDTNTGPTADFPISGYAATDGYVKENPKTVAAFQRAMQKAQGMVADRKVLESVIPSIAKGVDAKMAALLYYGTFPTTLNATRLQRVADVMLQLGYLKSRLDVKPMLYLAPPRT